METLNKTILAVGKKGTGKTTIALKIAEATNKKIVVVDTQVHPTYIKNGFEVIEARDLPKCNKPKIIVCNDNIDAVLTILDKQLANRFIILEDSNRYLSNNFTYAQKTFLLNHRQRNFDIMFLYHYLSAIPPILCKNYDKLICFKTLDNLDENLKKFPNWKQVKELALRVRKNSNDKYCEFINGE